MSTLLKKIKFDITSPERRIFIKRQNSNRLRSLGHIQTEYEFIRALWQALKIYRPNLVFEPAYPNYVLDREDAEIQREGKPAPEIPEQIITWMNIRRQPGSLDSVPFGKTKEIQPRVREELVYDPTLKYDSPEPESYPSPSAIGPDHKISRVFGTQVKGQFFDNLIQFDIWSKNNKTAEELTEFFEDFMVTFRPMFLELGVTKMHYHSRARDEMILNWRNGLINRTIRYYVRLEKMWAEQIREIRKINVNLEFHELLQVEQDDSLGRILDQYQNEIIRGWTDRFKQNI